MCGWCGQAAQWPLWLFTSLQDMAESVRKQTGKMTRCPECAVSVEQIIQEKEPACLGQALVEEARKIVT